MTRYAAFLRGINLGRRRVTGATLREPFVGLGLSGVDTFLASGNVVFDAPEGRRRQELEVDIAQALEEDLGFAVETFLRSAGELDAIVARTPFSTEEMERSRGKIQVILFRQEPPPEAAAALLAHASEDDRLALRGTELYWLPAGNMSDSELDPSAIDRLVGPTTTRTANTLARFHARYFQGRPPPGG
jgi:uncharacterized protein (DUF1697 family)